MHGFVLVFLMREEHDTPQQYRALQLLHRWPYPREVCLVQIYNCLLIIRFGAVRECCLYSCLHI